MGMFICGVCRCVIDFLVLSLINVYCSYDVEIMVFLFVGIFEIVYLL